MTEQLDMGMEGDVPVWPHNCEKCKFIVTLEGEERAPYRGGPIDFYVCNFLPDKEEIVFRYGEKIGQTISRVKKNVVYYSDGNFGIIHKYLESKGLLGLLQ